MKKTMLVLLASAAICMSANASADTSVMFENLTSIKDHEGNPFSVDKITIEKNADNKCFYVSDRTVYQSKNDEETNIVTATKVVDDQQTSKRQDEFPCPKKSDQKEELFKNLISMDKDYGIALTRVTKDEMNKCHLIFERSEYIASESGDGAANKVRKTSESSRSFDCL